MKSAILILILVVIPVTYVVATSCYPTEIELGRIERGCEVIYKDIRFNIRFTDGFSTIVKVYGNGNCMQGLTCSNTSLPAKAICWPAFANPYEGPGLWERWVQDRKALPVSIQCGPEGHRYTVYDFKCGDDPAVKRRYFRLRHGCMTTCLGGITGL